MSDLISHVIPLAVGAAISPTILTLSVLVLSGPHGRARQAVFTLVNVTLMAGIAVLGLSVMKHVTATKPGSGSHEATAAIYLTLGIVLILLAIREHFQPAKDTEQAEADDAAKSKGVAPLRYALLAVVLTATNFTTMALYLPALREIAVASAPYEDKALIAIVLIAISTVTAWLPLLASLIVPGAAGRALAAIHRFTTTYKHQIVQIVLLAFGAYMVVKGAKQS